MSNCPFCNLGSEATPGDGSRSRGIFRRAWQNTRWLFPAAMLALIPKCPLCVAAYVALFTGIGISVPTARWIQILMLVVCLTGLGYFAGRNAARYLARVKAE